MSALLLALFLMGCEKKPVGTPEMPEGLDKAQVVWVSDGDTIIIKIVETGEASRSETAETDEEITVRLIGIDAPESVHRDESKNTEEGKKASDFVKGELSGNTVYLEYDVQSWDKYGRRLAYVWHDGQLFNKRVLEEGHAELLTIPPNVKYEDVFEAAYKEGRDKKN